MKHKEDRFSSQMNLVFLFSVFLFFSLETPVFVLGNDTLFPGESLSLGSQPLVSNNGIYKLSFFNVSSYFDDDIDLAISHGDNTNIVWHANRVGNAFLSDPILNLSKNGELVVLDYDSKHIIWSPGNKTVSTNLVLLNTGNLVLRDSKNSSRIFWQSFDHPTDTWLPGAPLGVNISLSLTFDYLFDGFSLEIDPGTTRGFIIRGNSTNLTYHGAFPDWMDIREDSNHFLTFYDTTVYSHLYVKLSEWRVSLFQWVNESSNTRVLIWSQAPDDSCDYSFCGPYGLCQNLENNAGASCTCPFGFHPNSTGSWDWDYYNGGSCLRNISLDCEITNSSNYVDSFYSIDNINKFPDDPQFLVVETEDECEAFCFTKCSCIAYSYTNNNCSLWFGNLLRTNIRSDGRGGDVMNIRLRNMVEEQKKLTFFIGNRNHIIMLILGIMVISAMGSVATFLYKRKYFLNPSEVDNMVLYSYGQIKRFTTKFSKKIGEGGFGSVFKGQLPDSSFVAVKKLKTLCYEEKQFRSEIQSIGIIQHVNLVKLRGFCAEGTKRMLVYEYMPNGSLNSHLFSNSKNLVWGTRYQIVEGIAKGLAYLHEECRDCIIHCDIKPENILLDENFCPKIADFGMAKLLGRNFSRALTTMRGTIGYLAPEWIYGQPITQKADVYSFGMMLFEIISGRRNVEKIKNRECTYFPLYAAIKINQGEALCLLDERLEMNGNVDEIEKACKVACWCIQDLEDDRPTMTQVLLMLQGVLKIEMPPIPKSLQTFVDFENDSSYCDP